jgi:DNA repair protein RecO (recombination protein O)
MLVKDQAICIRATDYSETSQVVTLFTKANGKVRTIAKGSKRPKSAFDGPIEIFSHGRIVFSDSTRDKLATLTEFEPAAGGGGFRRLSSNLFVWHCCLFAAELVDSLADDYDPHPELFDSFVQFLQDVEDQQAAESQQRETLAILILFQLALLKEVGLQPVLKACANCKRPFSPAWPECYFSSSANGLICRDCEGSFPDRTRVSDPATACLSNLKMIEQADRELLGEIESLLVYHFTETLHRPPRMAKHLLKS